MHTVFDQKALNVEKNGLSKKERFFFGETH